MYSHIAFMACLFLDLLLSLSQQIIALGYYVPDPQLIELTIRIPLLPENELCLLESWQVNAIAGVTSTAPVPALQLHTMQGMNTDITKTWWGWGSKKEKQTGFLPSLG